LLSSAANFLAISAWMVSIRSKLWFRS
jgi:hypothetical protein